ncbi:uncharacterized protein LAESUDRAFT_748484 [Laetiporus sulphureus 93-53]|uniref:Uncharacterized protein n=1 Tax=Laetiporus sulphureus 93-53 TaxID=1314785 RepID=A0A165FRP3_9APHY|nr:uncharacterized protein LAESUDRAFT_748484 [Laetiporus sulphureus 93-53]KZT09328.1 hypothetical protein LAESUDRAFT_748484 [Laetiporus sulphureus 93-53]
MAIMDSSNGEQDIARIWNLLLEVSDQLTQNRSVSLSLNNVAGAAKTQAIHSQTGFVLRRFNLEKPKDVYEAELERMNTAMSAENQTLQNDNRQLNALIREYEQTLETVMSSFRTHAYEVQQRELAVMREYESVIIQRESETLDVALTAGNARSQSLARVGRLLRAVMRKLAGEDIKAYEDITRAEESRGTAQVVPPVSEPSQEPTTAPDAVSPSNAGTTASEDQTEQEPDLLQELDEDDNPELLQRRLVAAEWALDRESELARLERENEELRMLLNDLVVAETAPVEPVPVAPRHAETAVEENNEEGRSSPTPSTLNPHRTRRQLGGPPGTVGPFGSYKRRSVT